MAVAGVLMAPSLYEAPVTVSVTVAPNQPSPSAATSKV